jgi:hypothetical protein
MLFWTWRDSGRGKWLEQGLISRQERLDFGQKTGGGLLFSLAGHLGVTTAEIAGTGKLQRAKIAACFKEKQLYNRRTWLCHCHSSTAPIEKNVLR